MRRSLLGLLLPVFDNSISDSVRPRVVALSFDSRRVKPQTIVKDHFATYGNGWIQCSAALKDGGGRIL